jgi:hypothetical protein
MTRCGLRCLLMTPNDMLVGPLKRRGKGENGETRGLKVWVKLAKTEGMRCGPKAVSVADNDDDGCQERAVKYNKVRRAGRTRSGVSSRLVIRYMASGAVALRAACHSVNTM